MTPEVSWLDSRTAEVSGIRFLVSAVENGDGVDDADRLLLVKDADYLRRCAARFRALAPRNIVEIGILHGGSVMFWNLVLRPERQLAFDLSDRSAEPLRRFAASAERHGRLELRFGLDQADRASLTALAAEVFGDEPIDLIIDGGSHSYPEKRASLETLLPRLRPGGAYVIEDWGWAHIDAPEARSSSANRPALTNLIVELLMVCGSRTGVIDELLVEPHAVLATRGTRPLDPAFTLAGVYSNRGLPFRPLL